MSSGVQPVGIGARTYTDDLDLAPFCIATAQLERIEFHVLQKMIAQPRPQFGTHSAREVTVLGRAEERGTC